MASSSLSHKHSFSDFQRETPAVSKKVYDAFINHRGPDVKETLAFALYDALEEKECWTFLDDMELQLGDSITSAIQDAIYSSRVQIAIFSPRYAESSWCLDELLLMLETKARFIPIFCDVKPFELRYPDKGVYKTAFAKHEEKGRFNDKIDQWKAALHSSSLISGYEFTTSTDNVEMLCTKISLAVQQEVGKTFKGIGKDQKYLQDAASTSGMVKKSSLLPRDSRPVGIESKVKDMVGLLEDPKVQVIAVVGMGGSGKTFLLQNVYKAVKSKYAHSIWLSISKSYSLKNLQHDVASHIGLRREIVDGEVTEERAAELIQERLEGKTCLIVLDDLWTLSTENSLIDKLGLPADNDCKVVVTTRNRQVALNSGAQIYEMKNLSDEDSWKLFCIYAFPGCVGNRATLHMEEEGRKIVKQCGNLPLAIKTIAASLANCRLLSKWELKRRQLERVITLITDPDPIMEILKLSYDSLSAHLKPCFAYLSIFSEDEDIFADYLINLWIAEGFIPAGEDQWEIGWDWLDQLDQLCLLQVYEGHGRFYSKKTCKIHDLLYDLAIQISKEDKCVFSLEEVSPHASGATGWCRISLAKKGLHDSAISEIHPVYLRTLSMSQNEKITSIPENLFATMRGLRILDLSSTNICTLPGSLGKMILLKLLNLCGTKIREVPDCVRNMKSLLFLALPHYCSQLPVWISELRCLQHLECWDIDHVPKGISKLTSLRTLRSDSLHFSIEEDEFMSLDDLVDMAQLQELFFFIKHEMELKRLEEGILAQLVKMRHLEIRNKVSSADEKETELPKYPEKMRAMKHLDSLTLEGFVVPSWICEFANMRELNISQFEFSDCPELQILPNLVMLVLEGNEKCEELPKAFGKSGGFPQLLILKIYSFSSLRALPELEDGAMARLQQFNLWSCPNVKKVEGLERLKTLESFQYYDSGGINDWCETLKEGGEYWNKIKAINPNVTITVAY